MTIYNKLTIEVNKIVLTLAPIENHHFSEPFIQSH